MEPKPYLSVEEYLEACAKGHDTARVTATIEALLTWRKNGLEMANTASDFKRQLGQALRERDEARAEVERLHANDALQKEHITALIEKTYVDVSAIARRIAERQREADVSFVFNWLREQVGILDPVVLADEMPTPPLVTEGDK